MTAPHIRPKLYRILLRPNGPAVHAARAEGPGPRIPPLLKAATVRQFRGANNERNGRAFSP